MNVKCFANLCHITCCQTTEFPVLYVREQRFNPGTIPEHGDLNKKRKFRFLHLSHRKSNPGPAPTVQSPHRSRLISIALSKKRIPQFSSNNASFEASVDHKAGRTISGK